MTTTITGPGLNGRCANARAAAKSTEHQHAMTVLSLSEAAAATGLNKTTVLRSIKSGKIMGTRDPLGQWQIDAAELHRVYPSVADATAAKTHSEVLNSLMRMARQRLGAPNRPSSSVRWTAQGWDWAS